MSKSKVDPIPQAILSTPNQKQHQNKEQIDLNQQNANNTAYQSEVYQNQSSSQSQLIDQNQPNLVNIDQIKPQNENAESQQLNIGEQIIQNNQRVESPVKDGNGNSIEEKLKLKKELEVQLMNLQNQIEFMEDEEIKQGFTRVGSQTKESQVRRGNIDKDASSEEYVKKINELEKERKTLKQNREERIQQYEIALKEQLKKEREDSQTNRQNMKQIQRIQSERGIAEIERRKRERSLKIKEENENQKEIAQQKPLYVSIGERYSQQQNQELEEKKKQLAAIREIAKPIDFIDIKSHQQMYDLKKKNQEQVTHRKVKSEWNNEKPMYKSKIYDNYNNDLEYAKNSDEYKIKNAHKIIERRALFSKVIKENHKPKQDPNKEIEIKQIHDKIHTKPRPIKDNDVQRAEGNLYLKESLESIKRNRQIISAQDLNSYHKEQQSVQMNSFLTPIKTNQNISAIQLDSEGQNPNFRSQADLFSANKRRQMSTHAGSLNNSQISSITYKRQKSQEGLTNANIFLQLQENLNKQKRVFDSNEDKKKFFDYVQKEYRKELGTKYMSTRLQNPQPINLKDHLKEQVDKELHNDEDAPQQKIQVVRNIIKPFEDKANRDHKLLNLQDNDEQVRNNVADTYVSTIKAKLTLISKIQEESYEMWLKKGMSKIIQSETMEGVYFNYFNYSQILIQQN